MFKIDYLEKLVSKNSKAQVDNIDTIDDLKIAELIINSEALFNE